MSRGTRPGTLRSAMRWASFVGFALVLISGDVSYAEVCDYDGGWSLRSDKTCPAIANKRCSLTLDESQARCCPEDYECRGVNDFEDQFCCKGTEDCRNKAIEHAKCPDPSMTLWGPNSTTNGNNVSEGVWCCEYRDVGVYKDNGQVGGLVFLCTGTEVTALATTLYSASRLSQCSMTSTPTTTFASTSTTASGEKDSSVDVPTGAIAGGVLGGIAVIALVVIGIHFFFLKKKRRDRGEQPSTEAPVQEGQPWPQQLRIDSQRSWRRPSELETVEPRLEMNGVKPTYELDAAEEQERERDISPMSPPR